MDDFFKTKVGFTIGLLAAVFAIKPIIEANASAGFIILNYKVTIEYAYLFLTFCLSLAVYFISLQFISEKPIIALNKISGFCYTSALATPPVYLGLWLVSEIPRWIAESLLIQIPAIWANPISGIVSGIFTVFIYDFIRKTIKQKFISVEKLQERKEDLELLTKSYELFKSGMYDMSVLESSKIVESIIHQLLEARGIRIKNKSLNVLVRLSEKNGILNKLDVALMHEIRKKRNQSQYSFDAIDKEIAERILFLSRNLISKLDLSTSSSSYEWLESNRENVLELFKTGESKKCQVAIKKLIDAWIHRDGALWLEVSDFFEIALIHNPSLIIESFSCDESLLESWLECIEIQLFKDFLGGQVSKLENNKVLMLKSLSKYINRNDITSKNMIAAHKIMHAIQVSKITEVD